MTDSIDSRVAASLAVLDDHLSRLRSAAPVGSSILDHAYRGLAHFALGGKHMRARLVHIGAGAVDRNQLHAATVFGACVDLMHGAFLIHDDVIDRDDFRRGSPTVHAAIRDEFGDDHLGMSVAIVAGDLGLTATTELLLRSSLDDALVRRALRILNEAAGRTIVGEILDIAHSVLHEPTLELVRLSNHLKTSDYSFSAPLRLGALAAGRDPAAMGPIGKELGCAYQAADDIAGVVGLTADTGKATRSDIKHGRATLMTLRMDGYSDDDPERLAVATADVVAEGLAHLDTARELIDGTSLATDIRQNLLSVTATIEGTLTAYV